MDLRRNPITSTLHRGDCPRADKKTIVYRFADSIPDEAALTAETRKYPMMHLCQECLRGVCACKECELKGTDG